MKKFMLFILVAVLPVWLSGCATENPHARKAQLIGGTVAGALIGGKALNGGVLGGLAGAAIGHEAVKAAHWKPGDDEVEVITVPPGYSGRHGGYSSCGAVSVPCRQTRVPAGSVGYCNDEDSGGYATYEDLVRRAERRAGCYDTSGYQAPPVQRASYAPSQQVVYPQNIWERPEKRQKEAPAEKKVAEEAYDGPTVSDYVSPKWASVIPDDCRTGNYGRDSNCLYAEAERLKTRQEECEADSKKCKQGFNFGQMAWYDRKLAGDLRRAQDKFK